MRRTAECACGRAQRTVDHEPLSVLTCHFGYCQRRTGSVSGERDLRSRCDRFRGRHPKTCNGLENNGVGSSNGADVSYRFCPTCGSTVFWTFRGRPIIVIAVGSFGDPEFPMPTAELHTLVRHHWVPPTALPTKRESRKQMSHLKLAHTCQDVATLRGARSV